MWRQPAAAPAQAARAAAPVTGVLFCCVGGVRGEFFFSSLLALSRRLGFFSVALAVFFSFKSVSFFAILSYLRAWLRAAQRQLPLLRGREHRQGS